MTLGDLPTSSRSLLPRPRSAASTLVRDVDETFARASDAQQELQSWDERQTDRLLTALSAAAVREARPLAELTVTETGLGCVADKTVKNTFAASAVLRSLLGRTGCGTLRHDAATGVTEVARPVGVVLGLMPVTNPVATLIYSALVTLKARNALVVRAHPRATCCSERAARLLRAVLAGEGAPADLIQVIPPGNREQLTLLFQHPGIDLILATGSTGLVRAAVASGTPTLGAGGGNAPAWVCADADLPSTARHVVASKSFDHGMICGSEQHLVVDTRAIRPLVGALRETGTRVLTTEEGTQLATALFSNGQLRPDLIGRSAPVLAATAGINTPPQTRLLVVPLPASGYCPAWDRERLIPVLTLREVDGPDQALARCCSLLAHGGAGHTAAIHTSDENAVLRMAERVQVSRLVVNGPAAQGCIGATTGLDPSLTLACGPDGGATTTDNITFRHLQKVVRIAQPLPSRGGSSGTLLLRPGNSDRPALPGGRD